MLAYRVQFGNTRPGVCSVHSHVGCDLSPCLSQGHFRFLPASRHDWQPQPGSMRGLRFDKLAEISVETGENQAKSLKKQRCRRFDKVTNCVAGGSRPENSGNCTDAGACTWPRRPKPGQRPAVVAPVLPVCVRRGVRA
jgi:hypothetical protein